LVELMGGEISVESQVDKGSTFRVELREVRLADAAALAARNQPSIDADAVRFARASVLIVDDIEVNRNLVKGYLDQYDLALFEASNGEEAVRFAEEHHPDLVLMDLKMPVMDGYEATRRIKGDGPPAISP
jgi:PleD family two-component response regulator